MSISEERQQSIERYRDAVAELREAEAEYNENRITFEEVQRLRENVRNALHYL